MTEIAKERLNEIADGLDADLLVFNSELMPPVDFMVMQRVAARKRRKNIVMFLTTEGGLSDAAFRIMRFLQSKYERVIIVVSGWCNRQLDALENLLSGYFSHGFVIDLKEAEDLFKVVKPLSEEMQEIVGHLGTDALWPRNRRQDQAPRLEFLNDEATQSGQAQAGSGAGGGGPPAPARPRGRGRDRPQELPGDSPEGGGEEPAVAANLP